MAGRYNARPDNSGRSQVVSAAHRPGWPVTAGRWSAARALAGNLPPERCYRPSHTSQVGPEILIPASLSGHARQSAQAANKTASQYGASVSGPTSATSVPYTNNILLDLRNGIECQDNGKGRVISMPGKKDRNDRIRQDVTDISSPDELLRLALAGQLEPRARRDHRHAEPGPGPGRRGQPVLAGLAAFAERRDTIRGSSLAARVPPSWTRKILAAWTPSCGAPPDEGRASARSGPATSSRTEGIAARR